jgi:hypothetical protein
VDRLRPEPIEVKEGGVTSVAFGPQGVLAVGYSRGGAGGVVLLDANGDRLPTEPIEVKHGIVSRLAFGPQGVLAVQYSQKTQDSRVLLLDARGDRLRPEPIEVKEGGVTSVAFSPQGVLAVAGINDDPIEGGVGIILLNEMGKRKLPFSINLKKDIISGVRNMAFGPAGVLAVGYGGKGPLSGGVMLIDAYPDSWREKVRQVANRNFTWAEWTRFFPDQSYRRTIRAFPWPRDLPDTERARAEAFEKEHPERKDAP